MLNPTSIHATKLLVISIGMILCFILGCSRSYYRTDADEESYVILEEKTGFTPWPVPTSFTINADPRSRLFDPTDFDAPELPVPAVDLHTYSLPELEDGSAVSDTVTLASSQEPAQETTADQKQVIPEPADEPGGAGTLPIRPIAMEFWDAVPQICLARMFEFESVRAEYRRQYQDDPPNELRDFAQKLDLERVVALALINSREYQTQKESLYQAALALTLERFDYDTKFSTGNNRTAIDARHARSNGTTTNNLTIPSALQADKMLATSGSLLARFANDVVLTFNGPDGFAADIGSELLFNLQQSIFQRDVLLNPLIQSERDVVYAARRFARFRKTFFFQLASQYYALLRTYRQIEIDAQNYFSLVRALEQAEAEVRAGIQTAPSRIQVEQIEQQMLSGRSGLINSCNNLERALDRLKIAMGLPTELPINLDLNELEALTLSDQIGVAAELATRAQRRVQSQRDAQPPDRAEVLNAVIVLSQRLLEWMNLQPAAEGSTDRAPLEIVRARFRADEARLDAEDVRLELDKARDAVPPAPAIQVFQLTMDLVDALLKVVDRRLQLAALLQRDPTVQQTIEQRSREARQQAEQLRQELARVLTEAELAQVPRLRSESEQLLMRVEGISRAIDVLEGAEAKPAAQEEALRQTLVQADELLQMARRLLEESRAGLPAPEMSFNDAMATALTQRFDLMNQRGFLADDWREIKLAADDLKSVLNLNVSQSLRTRRNRPFGFTFNDSTTQVGLALDLPLNRKAQRNSFRRALIGYQVSRRDLMEAQDNVKLAIRDELRDLGLASVQYQISVASAALANERVLSTRLSLALGFPGVQARDFLEAQDAFRAALGRVADNHIGYLVDRARYFLDLELMFLDEAGFWPGIADERQQPAPNTTRSPGAGPVYGEIPEFLKVSPTIRRAHGGYDCTDCPDGHVRRAAGTANQSEAPPEPVRDFDQDEEGPMIGTPR